MLASVWIATEAFSFYYGFTMAGHVLGWSLVATALVPVTTGFCISSFIYGLMFGKPQAVTASA